MITCSCCVKSRQVIISICFKSFLTWNNVVDVKQISYNSEKKSAKTWKKSKSIWWRNDFWITIKDHSSTFPPCERLSSYLLLWRAFASCLNLRSTKPLKKERPPWIMSSKTGSPQRLYAHKLELDVWDHLGADKENVFHFQSDHRMAVVWMWMAIQDTCAP